MTLKSKIIVCLVLLCVSISFIVAGAYALSYSNFNVGGDAEYQPPTTSITSFLTQTK